MTQEKLAEKAELSTQTIADIEECRTWVSDKTLVKIAEILKTTPTELLNFLCSKMSLPKKTIELAEERKELNGPYSTMEDLKAPYSGPNIKKGKKFSCQETQKSFA